ncbi:MAG: AraC family transcriptional regulator N-terminal domain-containing protein [Hyphomonas sp.]
MTDPLFDLASRLADTLSEGVTRTTLPGVELLKITSPGELTPEVHKPMVSLIIQGRKRLLIGAEVLHYQGGDTYVAAVDLPMRVEILGCTRARPYLAVKLGPDPALIADLAGRSGTTAEPSAGRAFAVHPADAELRDAYRRLLQLRDRPEEIAVLGPLIQREILFRLLRGPQGPILRKIAGGIGHGTGIGPAISLIRAGYAGQIRVSDLARASGMSLATLHRRFKAETGMSPLQYRSFIRLYEARSRLITSPGNVAGVAFSLGYESASQFSREYARAFGAPPMRDARRIRAGLLDERAENPI